MKNDSAISVQHVSKSFKLPHEKTTGLKQAVLSFRPGRKYEMQHVLKDVSFEIKKGEFFGIVGKNGSGKSTLLKLLAQIYTPEKGGITINGSLTPFIELGVGFNPELTGRENVYLNGALLGFDRSQMNEMYQDIVDFAELGRFMDQRLKNYSSGMQVRLAFSIAIKAKSDILLIDEVLAVGDAAFQQKCFKYFEKIKKSSTTIILVTHDMDAVRRFCTSAILLQDGILKKHGRPSEIASAYTLGNIESASGSSKAPHKPSTTHLIAAKIIKEEAGSLELVINYESQGKQEMYVGISVLRNGISIAELTTDPQIPLAGSGVVRYILDTSIFNPGVYEIAFALFRSENRELLSAGANTLTFVIDGYDPTKGAAVKLEDTWEYGATIGKD